MTGAHVLIVGPEPRRFDDSKVLEVKIATRRSEILQCQYFIAEVYNGAYNIVFSSDIADLNQAIEPYPDRYVMGLIDGKIVAAAGLYIRKTYVATYGGVTDEEIDLQIAATNMSHRYTSKRKREYTKLVVRGDHNGMGIGRFFHAVTHSKSFVEIDASEPHILLCCAKRSIYNAMYPKERINTRFLKPFPHYAVHENYSSPDDPMDSRLIIPEIDIAPEWYNLELPVEFSLQQIRLLDPKRGQR
jgi:hypothetical protein